MRHRTFLATLAALSATIAAPAFAQLSLPGLQGIGLPSAGLPGIGLPRVGDVLEPVTDALGDTIEATGAAARRLVRQRADRIGDLVSAHPDLIELDAGGEPARKGELLVLDAPAGLGAAAEEGFAARASETIEGLGITVTRVAVPDGMSLAQGQERLAALLPGATVSSDPLHFQSGGPGLIEAASVAASGSGKARTAVGMIDGAPGASVSVLDRRGFADGAPIASNHGSAVASLLSAAGVSNLRVADVYGTDPAGGNALAIARGLGWLTAKGSRVVTISLVGPENPVLARAIEAAQRKGVVVLAAVGNDGPASPASYPASYKGVLAITGVDRKGRALIEAGRALHLDYAAPGADIRARDKKGRLRKVRGTSYATPLAAARVAAALDKGGDWRRTLDAEARELGPEKTYGRGLLCGSCGHR